MNLAPHNTHVIEEETSRALAAIRLVDATTQNPLTIPARVEVLQADIVELVANAAPTVVRSVAAPPGTVRVQTTLRGWLAVTTAPGFDTYITTFLAPENPVAPPAERRLRLRLAARDAGPSHLPRFFELVVPRSLDRADDENIFTPHDVPLLRAPGAPIAEGWATLRVRVQNAAGETLPGVLVRAFRRPRPVDAEPLGVGLTEWRDPHLRGEAVVPIPGLLRFAPGSGPAVLETTHAIEIEATRHSAFPDAASRISVANQLPDVDALLANTGATVVRRVSTPGPTALGVIPAGPHTIATGETLTLTLTLP